MIKELIHDPIGERYWGKRKYKELQCQIQKIEYSKEEKMHMSFEIIGYIRDKGYTLYHDFMDDISESHSDWFNNMLTFDKNYNKSVLIYIKNKAKKK